MSAREKHRCGCGASFRTPQGLGLHFAWKRRKALAETASLVRVRWERARAEMLDLATELVSRTGGVKPGTPLTLEQYDALTELQSANNEWQEAQLALHGEGSR